MTSRYILDENVVIYAQRGLNEYDEPNLDCRVLFERIANEDERSFVVDDVLWAKYDDQLYNPVYLHPERGPFIRIRLWELTRRAGKIEGLGHTAPHFPEETDIPQGSQDDRDLVRLAVEESERGATLVTTDRPLRDDLAACSIQTRYGLSVLSPEGALAAL